MRRMHTMSLTRALQTVVGLVCATGGCREVPSSTAADTAAQLVLREVSTAAERGRAGRQSRSKGTRKGLSGACASSPNSCAAQQEGLSRELINWCSAEANSAAIFGVVSMRAGAYECRTHRGDSLPCSRADVLCLVGGEVF